MVTLTAMLGHPIRPTWWGRWGWKVSLSVAAPRVPSGSCCCRRRLAFLAGTVSAVGDRSLVRQLTRFIEISSVVHDLTCLLLMFAVNVLKSMNNNLNSSFKRSFHSSFIRQHYSAYSSLIQQSLIPEQFTVKAHPALFEGEGGGGSKKNTTRFFNTFIPVYIQIHIQNETSKSNISKTVRDREKVSMEVR